MFESVLSRAPQLSTPASWGLARLALGGTLHSGRAPLPRRAQREAEARAPASVKAADSEAFDTRHGGRPTHLQKASSQEYQRAHKELRRASQRLLLLGMSCGSLAEEGTKSSPGRCSRRGSATLGAVEGQSSCASPGTVGALKH